MAEEIINEEEILENEELAEEEFENEGGSTVYLQTHEKINHDFSGNLERLDVGHAVVHLETIEEMRADGVGLVHGGFIFCAADYAAMAAVNERNVVLAGSECQFLAPIRMGDMVVFDAKVRHKEGRKRNVHVEGFVHDVKVFSGEFKTVVTEQHVLRLSLLRESELD